MFADLEHEATGIVARPFIFAELWTSKHPVVERSDAEMRCGPGYRGIVVVNVDEIQWLWLI